MRVEYSTAEFDIVQDCRGYWQVWPAAHWHRNKARLRKPTGNLKREQLSLKLWNR